MALRGLCCCVVFSLIAVVFASEASAVVLLHDQFLENGALNGKTPTPGPGPAWNAGAQTGINPVSVVDGEALLLQTESANSEDVANVFGDQSATAITYAGFDFQLPSTSNTTLASDADVIAEGVFYVTLRGTSASTSQRARAGFVPPEATGDYRMAINADNGNLVAGATFPMDLDFDTIYRAVISFDASNAQSGLWVDPVDEMSTSVSHTGIGTSIGTIINRIILRQHNSYNGTQLVDNVIVATTFAEALGIDDGDNGDFNGDGFVNAADYVTWRKNNGPQSDYELWQMTFGETVGGGGLSNATVPEPATMLFFAIGTTMLCGTRRHARISIVVTG